LFKSIDNKFLYRDYQKITGGGGGAGVSIKYQYNAVFLTIICYNFWHKSNFPQIEPEGEFLYLLVENKVYNGSESEICVGF